MVEYSIDPKWAIFMGQENLSHQNPLFSEEVIEQMRSTADTSWFLTKPVRRGSDGVWTARELYPDHQLVGALVSKKGSHLPLYKGEDLDVVVNPAHRSFTITFKENGKPGYATFPFRDYTIDLVMLNPNIA